MKAMEINTNFGHWVRVAPYTGFRLQKFSRPMFVAGEETPGSLDELTIGQIIELSTIGDSNESFFVVCRIVLPQLSRVQVEGARAVDVVRFVGWVAGEIERINRLFKSSEAKPSQEEEMAGIKTLKFGLFGMLDWYAQRMQISDHDEVLSVPWMRIWKCLDMDNKRNIFNKRLQEVYNDEYRRKNQRNS